MALTPDELQELALLRGEKAEGKLDLPSGELSPEEMRELKQLRREDRDGEFNEIKNAPISYEEAELGTWNRARHSIEPIESNRMALLVQEFGKENVATKDGEAFIKQEGKWRPVNVDGLSTADFAEFAGTLPEMAGAGLGAVVGLGAGSVPASMVGAGAGSAIRQAGSALLGTPQVATGIERATELGLSAGTAGVFTAGGKALKWGAKKAIKQARKSLPGLDFGDEGRKLIKIAKSQGIPEPTSGQLIGDRAMELEKALGEKRIFGASIRKKYEAQSKAIKTNLKDFAGDFIDADTPLESVGKSIKDQAEHGINQLKKIAGQNFDDAVRAGSGVTVPAKDFQVSLLDNFNKLGLFDMNGNPMRHSSKTGLTADQFKRLQGITKTLMEDTKTFQKEGFIDANAVNTMRKFVDKNITEGKMLGVDDALLIRLKNGLLDTTEDMLKASDPKALDAFQNGRWLWKEYLDANKIFSKGGLKGLGIKDLSEEKVLKKVFADKNSVKNLRHLIGDEATDEAGVAYIHSILSTKLGGVDQVGAQGALNMIKKSKAQIVEAIGEGAYTNLRNNLYYLEKIGRPINPSKTAIMSMREMSVGNIVQGALEAGEFAARKGKHGIIGAMESGANLVERHAKKELGGLQSLSDEWQREQASKTRGPNAPKIPYRRY